MVEEQVCVVVLKNNNPYFVIMKFHEFEEEHGQDQELSDELFMELGQSFADQYE